MEDIYVVDALGKIVKEAKISNEPATLVAFFEALGFAVKRIGLEGGHWCNGWGAQASPI
jgi:transposase